MRSWISLAALAIAVAALALWVQYKPKPASSDSYALSQMDVKSVSRIRLETRRSANGSAATDSVVLEKSGSDWRMTAPVAARADRLQVERLFSILGAHSSVRYAASDRGRYGLDQPHAVLTLDGQPFTFGAINKTTSEQYVATGDHVYLVPLSIGAALPRSADALLSRNLFAPGEAPTRFDLPGFTVALVEGTWAVAPALPDVSADDRNAWVDLWRHAIAISAGRRAGDASRQEIKVQLKDDRSLAMRILQREPELVLLRTDEGIAYHFVAEVARRMLAPPGSAQPAR